MRKGLVVLTLVAGLTLQGDKARADIQSSPIGAAAECNDGMYSTTIGRGACSGHGGVKRELTSDGDVSATTQSNSQVSPSFSESPDAAQSGATLTAIDETDATATDDGLPNTGGAPLSMFLSGAALAAGGLFFKRRCAG